MTSKFIKTLNKTREYLDYIEEHYNNVQKAFNIITGDKAREIANGHDLRIKYFNDDDTLELLKSEVLEHDLSKFSKEEFVQYRESFYSIDPDEKKPLDASAWNHHKRNNPHHWQTKSIGHVNQYVDIVHNFIDWFAMSIKFGGRPLDYYRNNMDEINIPSYVVDIMEELEELVLMCEEK